MSAKLKPILFSTEMVRAILDGKKTQTRRVIKPRYRDNETGFEVARSSVGTVINIVGEESEHTREETLKYLPGDVLWVRETWSKCKNVYFFKASEDFYPNHYWKPSIHMPKKAARIFLKVKSVRAERLHDITENDAKREGITSINPLEMKNFPLSILQPGGRYGKGVLLNSSYKATFYELWEKLNKKRGYAWDSNPWVWVIEFERTEKPEGI